MSTKGCRKNFLDATIFAPRYRQVIHSIRNPATRILSRIQLAKFKKRFYVPTEQLPEDRPCNVDLARRYTSHMSIAKGFTEGNRDAPTSAPKKDEKIFLVGAELKSKSQWDVSESLEELASLAETAGGQVVGEGIQKLDRPVSGTFIGKGKAEQFAAECEEKEVDTVIFDDELTPGQGRNLERVFDRKIIDRTSLILDIFAQRARTREGKLQVELAQLQHLLPRLTRFWTHLSRQKGGDRDEGRWRIAAGNRSTPHSRTD